MKNILAVAIAAILFLLQSCGGPSSMPSLSAPEGLTKAQSLLQEKFKDYDGKMHRLYLGTDNHRDHTVDIISATFIKDKKEYIANMTAYTNVTESESKTALQGDHLPFSLKDVKLSELSMALKKASGQVLEKDKKFHDFFIQSVSFEKDKTSGNVVMSFDIVAKNPSTSYYGKRIMASTDQFTFSFKQEGDKVIATNGLSL